MNELQGAPLCYLASPYSLFNGGIESACVEVSKIAARLIRSGVNIFSPICHTHMIAVCGGIDPLDHSIWLPLDEQMMKRCDVLIIVHMDGWKASFGIAHEVRFFEDAGKPIFDLDPATFIMERRRGQTDSVTDERSSARLALLNHLEGIAQQKTFLDHR